MTNAQAQQITNTLGADVIAAARAQFETIAALAGEVDRLTGYFNDWDAAIEEDSLYNHRAIARDILAKIEAGNAAATRLTELDARNK
jgi:hypothetical protein